MNYSVLICLLFLSSLTSNAQSESDSLFYFDFRMRPTSFEDARWVSHKAELYDSTYIVKTTRKDTSRFLKEETVDEYTLISDKKMIINRSFSKRGRSLPGEFQIEVDIRNHQLGLYELDLYSEKLNVHRTVYSNTLIPICPIIKTIEYHPNCSVSWVDYHDKKTDSIWNSDGELITELFFDENVDSLPIIEGYEEDHFALAIKKHVQSVINYSDEARSAEIEGRVYTSFVITSSGKVEHIRIMIGVHPFIDDSSLDVLRKMRIARPAMKNGKPVNLRMTFPFSYHIQ